SVSINTESLILLRLDYHDGANDDLRMWINPDLSAGQPTNLSPSFVGSSLGEFDLAFNVVSMRAGTVSGGNEGQGFFDQIRIGTTYSSVIPEPGSCLLAALGFVAVGAVLRGKQG